MSERSDKKKKSRKGLKKVFVVIILASALLLLDGLAYEAWRIRESMPPPEPEPEPTEEATATPEPTPEPKPVYAGGYMVCEDGLFYPDRTLTLGELADALARSTGSEADLPGDPAAELTADDLFSALERNFGTEAALASMDSSALRGGDRVTRAEAAVILNAVLDPESPDEEGLFPDVDDSCRAAADIALAARSGRDWPGGGKLPEPGFVWVGGRTYCADDTGHFIRNAWVGSLYFGPDSRYTSGSYELDDYVSAAIAANTDESMTREEMLRAMYLYVRDGFTYLRRHYYMLGDTGWAQDEAITMYSTGKGNCYCYASAFWAAARALGYDAKIVSGKYGKEEAPHGWVEIFGEDGRLTYDVEMEMHYLAENKQMDLYAMDEVRRRGHGYRELAASDDLAPRETCEGLLPG